MVYLNNTEKRNLILRAPTCIASAISVSAITISTAIPTFCLFFLKKKRINWQNWKKNWLPPGQAILVSKKTELFVYCTPASKDIDTGFSPKDKLVPEGSDTVMVFWFTKIGLWNVWFPTFTLTGRGDVVKLLKKLSPKMVNVVSPPSVPY